MITGLDLVEWQIRVAQGEKLPKQNKIKIEGHSVEARIYAEDPSNDFMPSIGRIAQFDPEPWSEDGESGRVDTGVEEDDFISIHYDPMIAKAITHAEKRSEAIAYLMNLIDNMEICGDSLGGLKTNSGFVRRCLNFPAFIDGNISTHFIPQYESDLLNKDIGIPLEAYGLAAIYQNDLIEAESTNPFQNAMGWRLNRESSKVYFYDGPNGQIKVMLGSQTEQLSLIHI